jgi:hypothetical protein
MTYEDHYVTFSCSGRRIYAFSGILGLGVNDNPEGECTYGNDGTVNEHLGGRPLTRAERQELADHMVETWKRWAGL